MSNRKVLIGSRIRKTFPGTIALDDVDFDLKEGELHAIIGENGAGKSTFIKIISGIYKKDSGKLVVDGKIVEFSNTRNSSDMGIQVIYQELENLPHLSVAENIFLGRLPESRKLKRFVDWKLLFKNSKKLLNDLGVNIDPRSKLSLLSIAQQQIIAIAKALSGNLRILIMDEPTSVLNSREAELLFKIIHILKTERNVSIIYITHRLKEVVNIADRVTVFRDGRNIGTLTKSEVTENKIINMIIGHKSSKLEKKFCSFSNVVLEVKNLNIYKRLYNFDMKLYKGEILGIAGLIGSGKDELIKSLYGLWPYQKGEFYLNGLKVNIKEPFQVLNKNIVYLPEERKTQGLFLECSLRENISITWLNKVYKNFVLLRSREISMIKNYIKTFTIKTTGYEQKVINLSGGNQQKVIFSRLLMVKPQILLLHDPTRGIDIGSKEEIYKIINKLAEGGSSIVLVSSEIQEICNMSHRVIILSKGSKISELSKNNIKMENMLSKL